MVAQVAALEPETAAKMVQPMTLVCSSRPGRPWTHGANRRSHGARGRTENEDEENQ